MSLPPFSRDELRTLKIRNEEEQRNQEIQNIVKQIYTNVICCAKSTNETKFSYMNRQQKINSDYIQDIIEKLKILFPDCIVEYRDECIDSYGKSHDLSKIDKYSLQLKFTIQPCFIIDWT